MSKRVIFHLDLNYFFCRCEEIINPKLEQIPFVVGYVAKRSVISASNKMARTYGVKAAMKFNDAIKLCPQLKVVDVHFQLYEKKSHEFFQFLRDNFNHEIEVMSIDECFMDVTSILSDYHDNYEILALEIIKKVKQETGLYVTIGIGDNKFLAKMAGDTKPVGGIATLFQHEVKTKLWPLEIEKVFMVGKSTAQLLHNVNILTVLDFIQFKDHKLLETLLKPKRYNGLMEYCLGIGDDTIDHETNISKSISSGSTFEINTKDVSEIQHRINWLIDNVYNQLIDGKLLCQTLSVTIKYDYTNHVSKAFTRKQYTDDLVEIKATLLQLFNDLWNEDQELRAVTVALQKLVLKSSLLQQTDLNFNQ